MVIRILVAYASLVFFSTCSSVPLGDDVQFECHLDRTRIDSRVGTFEYYMGGDQSRIYRLEFSPEEKDSILHAANAINFFTLPHDVPYVPESTIEFEDGHTEERFMMVEPCSRYLISISAAGKYNWVAWSDCIRPLADHAEGLNELVRKITALVDRKVPYDTLPKRKWMRQ